MVIITVGKVKPTEDIPEGVRFDIFSPYTKYSGSRSKGGPI
jgi:hypothetical protein